jgi:hypothetical protein
VDTERIGPLSYSLDPPAGEFSAERPILVGTITAGAAAIPVCVVGWLAHSVIGNRSLVLWLGAAAIWAISLTVAWLLSPGRRRRRRNAMLGVSIAALVVSFGVYQVLDLSRPSIVQLRHSIADLDLPGWELVSEEHSGNRRCDPECPQLERVYRPPSQVENPGLELVRALLAQGWAQKDPNVPPDSATAAVKGRVLADVYSSFEGRDVRVVLQTDAVAPTAG